MGEIELCLMLGKQWKVWWRELRECLVESVGTYGLVDNSMLGKKSDKEEFKNSVPLSLLMVLMVVLNTVGEECPSLECQRCCLLERVKAMCGGFDEVGSLFSRNNDMIISWILNVVTEQISNNLNFVSSASKLWSELQEYYSQIDGHRIYQLTHDLIQLKQLNCVVEVYYQKLKGFWDELDALEAPHLCNCPWNCENRRENVERDQRKRLIQFLMGLDKGYSNIRGQILLMYPLPTADSAQMHITY
ncbi:cysteine-rich receptor-like protein kinase 8 [Tanacetum coccineum]